jgi:flagellar basal-body rod protein FlgG
MSQALWIAKTGLDAQQKRMAVISNNLANVNTTGYKKSRAIFEDLLYQNIKQVGSQSTQDTRLPTGLNLGTGVKTVATEKLFTQGNHVETGNPLNLEVQGRGFFQVLMPDGSLGYTRDGGFHRDEQGQMVTSNGYLIQPSITIPEDALTLSIGTDGVVSVVQPGSASPTQIGNIQLADFINPAGLQPVGQNIYLESASSGSPSISDPGLNGTGTVTQGALESSNVNVVEELVNMIEAQRAYEMNSKAISTADKMLQYVSNNL